MPSCEIDALEDIEDLFDKNENEDIIQRTKKHVVIPRSKSSKTRNRSSREKDVLPQSDDDVLSPDIIPGTQSIYVKTWGCSHNNSDSEYMSGQLAAFGYNITENREDAHLWLLNSCTVKNPAEDHFRNEIKNANNLGKSIVLAGCVSQGSNKSDYMKGLSIVGVQQIDRVVEVVEETLKGNTVRLLGTKKTAGKKVGGASLDLPKIRKNPLIEIIAINTGCLNQCTYCKTKHARGELGSYQPHEIVNRAKQSFEEGVVEIWLTSEDLGAYGRDIGVTLPELLWQLVEVIPDGAMMRLGMTNPPYILEHLYEISRILKHPRVYAFLHVPVQSGSDSVLGEMKREYCQADFRHVVDYLKEKDPDVNIATDIICGFPTETDADFEDTMQLVRDYKFASLFINQFFPRPGTPAAKMPRIPPPDVKKRTKAISELFHTYEPYHRKIGEKCTVLVTEVSHDKKHYVGHNNCYEQVLVPMIDDIMGKVVHVEIIAAGKHFMMGQILDGRDILRPSLVPPPLKKGELSGFDVSELQTVHKSNRDPMTPIFIFGIALALFVRYLMPYLTQYMSTS